MDSFASLKENMDTRLVHLKPDFHPVSKGNSRILEVSVFNDNSEGEIQRGVASMRDLIVTDTLEVHQCTIIREIMRISCDDAGGQETVAAIPSPLQCALLIHLTSSWETAKIATGVTTAFFSTTGQPNVLSNLHGERRGQYGR